MTIGAIKPTLTFNALWFKSNTA